MKKDKFLGFILFLGLSMILVNSYAQEEQEIQVEESAEVFLEEYSDEFQENFFEGLKQKGIQNYDRAINFLLECKRLQPDNVAVTHELARVYFLDKNYVESIDYAVAAVSAVPENYWYLNTLMTAVKKQGNNIAAVTNDIPMENSSLQENLARVYYNQEKYAEAFALLQPLKKSKNTMVLEQNIKDALAKKIKNTKSISVTTTVVNVDRSDLESYKSRIRGLLMMPSDNSILLQVSEEALENYPAQPYFYYANGYALSKKGKHKEAIEILEIALDYMVSDISLANKIYTELSTAYNAISNPSKANMYLRKVKPGF
ncbi:MAG: tetratricopeptide (TPR) repeat protein [Maribacter sp.]|jgi:tetratricopeptide (TPR) repeat protein